MSKNNPEPPRAFVSYSWSSQEHQDRILDWAERLVGAGVDIVLDKWHLKEGQDKYHFMEQMVKDPAVKKVLVFSDKMYAEKADSRKGGVGTESQIISREVYDKVSQDKFVPIVCQRDETGEPYLPVFLKSRMYFDFSSPETFHENYEKLVRAIYDKPLYKRPPLGTPPEFILTGEKLHLWSRPLLEAFRDAVVADKRSYQGHAATFLNAYAERLPEFRVQPETGRELDDQVADGIESFLPFRNDFVEFLNAVVRYRSETELYERIADFFERSLSHKFPAPQAQSLPEESFDTLAFILYELFVYLTAILVKERKLRDLQHFTERLYYVGGDLAPGYEGLHPFTIFRASCRSLAYRNERLKLGRLNLLADFMKQRGTLSGVRWPDIMQAEGLLLLKSLLSQNSSRPWYPNTLIYAGFGRPFELFSRAAQKREFEKLREFLHVANKEELIEKFNQATQRHNMSRWTDFTFHSGVDFPVLFGLDRLDSL